MIISCDACNKKFEINDRLIPPEGRTLQCGSCNHKWFFKKKVKKEKTIILDKPKKNIPENTEELINEAESTILKKTKKTKTKRKISILSILIVFIITFVALIILADTFKNSIKLFVPGFDIILDNLYESLKDVILFFKDFFK